MIVKSEWFVALCSGLMVGCMKAGEAPPGSVADSAPSAASPAPATWQVRYDGIGPIRIGASVAELEAALGIRFARWDSLDAQCDYLRAPEVIPGVWFMMIQGRSPGSMSIRPVPPPPRA